MKAHELLDTPEKWMQGDLACTKTGLCVDGVDPGAVRWCAIGAMRKCYREQGKELYIDKVDKLGAHILGNKLGCSIAHWNDTSTYETVVGVLKELDL